MRGTPAILAAAVRSGPDAESRQIDAVHGLVSLAADPAEKEPTELGVPGISPDNGPLSPP